MKIFVDADACPVVGIIEAIAEKYNTPATLLCDTNHVLYSDYSEVIVVGAGADAVDYKLISICHKGDIVVSQDYGVAAMALGKVYMQFINPASCTQMRILTGCLWKDILIRKQDEVLLRIILRGARCPVDIGFARTGAEAETQRSGQVKMTSVLHSHLRSLC